jgi:hypothetical protein
VSVRRDFCGADCARQDDRIYLTGDQARVTIRDWCVEVATGFIKERKAETDGLAPCMMHSGPELLRPLKRHGFVVASISCSHSP